MSATAAEVLDGLDLTGRTALVTGGYSGIGVEVVRALAPTRSTALVAWEAANPRYLLRARQVRLLAALRFLRSS